MKLLIKAEFSVLLSLMLFLYFGIFNLSFWLFILLFFIPDISILAYMINNKVGAILYNLLHSLILPAVLVGSYYVTDNKLLLAFGLILFAHIFTDRLFGFGLKYQTKFNHTHLDHI